MTPQIRDLPIGDGAFDSLALALSLNTTLAKIVAVNVGGTAVGALKLESAIKLNPALPLGNHELWNLR